MNRVALFLLFAFIPLRADITGTVTLTGHPRSKDETFVAQASNCGESPIRHTENWKIGPKGELADVVIWIVNPKCSSALGYPIPTPTLRQIGCRYEPHVLVLRAGDPLTIINGDPTLHNVHAKVCDDPRQPPGADVFNIGQVYQGQTDKQSFDQPGLYLIRCDVHSWMQCWVKVLPKAELPYAAVTGADGTFKLIGGNTLDDGDYKIDAWHPRFVQPLEKTIHVQKGVATIDFQFDAAQSF
jgi:hypothetical protein